MVLVVNALCSPESKPRSFKIVLAFAQVAAPAALVGLALAFVVLALGEVVLVHP